MTHRPAFILACAFAAGISVHGVLGAPAAGAVVVLLFAVAMAGVSLRRVPQGAVLIIFVFACGVLAAWEHACVPREDISRKIDILRDRDIEVVCRVAAPPQKRTTGVAPRAVFGCDLESADHAPCQGRVMVNFFGPAVFHFGERVAMIGKFSRPFDFSMGNRTSYRAYLARQGVHAVFHVRKTSPWQVLVPEPGLTIKGLALSLRVRLQEIFFRYLSPGEAGLMNAMLLGPRGDITPHVYDLFRRTGTAHIIAISGMNMALTAMGVMFLLGLLCVPRVPRAVLAALLIAGYSLVAGNSAPVARSAVMAAVAMLSFVVERETDVLNDLGLAALVLLAADPGQVSDIGCQLSFVCVAALIVITPLILEPFRRLGWPQRRWLWFFVESAGVTLAAFIGSAGIIAYDFGYLTPVGLLVNLPVIPMMALVTALGALVLSTGLFAPLLAGPCALCLKVVLNASVGVLALASRVPAIPLPQMSVMMLAAYYAVLGGIVFFSYHSQERDAGLLDAPQRLLL